MANGEDPWKAGGNTQPTIPARPNQAAARNREGDLPCTKTAHTKTEKLDCLNQLQQQGASRRFCRAGRIHLPALPVVGGLPALLDLHTRRPVRRRAPTSAPSTGRPVRPSIRASPAAIRTSTRPGTGAAVGSSRVTGEAEPCCVHHRVDPSNAATSKPVAPSTYGRNQARRCGWLRRVEL